MLLSPSFSSAFVSSINSLILSDFPLASFHLAEASLPAFVWLYTLLCAVIQKYQMSFFIIFPISGTHLEPACFIFTT